MFVKITTLTVPIISLTARQRSSKEHVDLRQRPWFRTGCKCKLQHVVTLPCSPLGERLRGIAGPDIKEVQEIHPDLHSVESRSVWLQRKPHFPCTNSFFASSTSELTCNWSQWQLLATFRSNSIIHKVPHSLQTLRPMTTCIFAGHQMSSYLFSRHCCFPASASRLWMLPLQQWNVSEESSKPLSRDDMHYSLLDQGAAMAFASLAASAKASVLTPNHNYTHNACCMGYVKYTICPLHEIFDLGECLSFNLQMDISGPVAIAYVCVFIKEMRSLVFVGTWKWRSDDTNVIPQMSEKTRRRAATLDCSDCSKLDVLDGTQVNLSYAKYDSNLSVARTAFWLFMLMKGSQARKSFTNMSLINVCPFGQWANGEGRFSRRRLKQDRDFSIEKKTEGLRQQHPKDSSEQGQETKGEGDLELLTGSQEYQTWHSNIWHWNPYSPASRATGADELKQAIIPNARFLSCANHHSEHSFWKHRSECDFRC